MGDSIDYALCFGGHCACSTSYFRYRARMEASVMDDRTEYHVCLVDWSIHYNSLAAMYSLSKHGTWMKLNHYSYHTLIVSRQQ